MKISNWCLSGEEADHPQNGVINKIFEDLVEDEPGLKEKTALVNAETGISITYGELNEKSNRIARMLLENIRKNGLKANSDGDYIVAMRFLPSEELVITILAIFKAGLAYVPIAPNWPEGRIRHIVDDASPIIILTNCKTDILYKAQKSLPILKKREVVQYDDMIEEALSRNLSTKNIPSNRTMNRDLTGTRLYAVLYTSGSTGTPKGVRHVHHAALNRFHWQWKAFPYEENEVCVFKTTLTFVDSVTEIWSPLLLGKKLVIFPTKVTQNVEKFVEELEKYQIGRIFVVTSLVRSMLAYLNLSQGIKKRLRNIKIWECSAETVTKDVLLSFFDYFKTGHTISNFYGSTEMMDVTYESFTSSADVLNVLINDKVPIGVPVDNTKAYVLDDNMEPVGDSKIGSLYISGRNLGNGYVGDKKGSFMHNSVYHMEMKESQEMDGIPKSYEVLYKTGDYATIHNGKLYYEGRLDSQVKVRGHRVDMAEIEKAVYQIEGVNKAIVLCCKPGEQQQRVVCYYTVKDGTALPEVKVEKSLGANLPDYMMPKLMKMGVLPVMVNGKIDRQSLLKKYEENLECTNFSFKEEDFVKHVPQGKFQEAKIVLESVSSIISDGTRKPTLSDNFFCIGGDSINMVMTIAKINDQGYHITVTDFVTSQQLSDVVDALTTQPMVEDLGKAWRKLQESNDYESGELLPEHKDTVLDMISRSFADKGDLTTLAAVSYDNLKDQLDILWDSLLVANLSIVIKNKDGKLLGSCLNFDARSEDAAPLCASSAFSRNMTEDERKRERELRKKERDSLNVNDVPMSVVEFLDAIEEPLKDKHLPNETGKFIYTSLLGTAADLSAAENVQVAIFMEQENIRVAKQKEFQGIFTTNANRLTQLISRSLDYEILLTVYVNQYEDDNGIRPFASAPDDLVTEVALKTF